MSINSQQKPKQRISIGREEENLPYTPPIKDNQLGESSQGQ